jgi:hypothetical protein
MGIDDSELENLLQSVVELMDAGRIEDARELADTTDDALAEQPNPELYGWLCFYRFKAAHALEAWEDAAKMFPPRFAFVVTPTNGAWIHSVRAEVAARMGSVDGVLENADRCISIRRQMGDTRATFLAARTACELLHQLGRDDLNTRFLPIVIDEARFAGELEHTAYGYVALVRNIIATGNPICIDTLLDAREFLARIDDECAALALDFVRTSPQVIEHLASRRTAKHRTIFAQR